MGDSVESDGTGWEATLQTANDMVAELADDGWTVVPVRAGHTAPELPTDGDTDRFGLVYFAEGDIEAELQTAVEAASFDGFAVFSNTAGGDRFLLTRITDSDSRTAVVLVGAVRTSDLADLESVALERGEMYSHVERIDRTHIASFHHEEAAPFFGGEQ